VEKFRLGQILPIIEMIKKIIIKDAYRTISLDFSLELEKMTIITGKNNSGKTNFITSNGDSHHFIKNMIY